MVNVLNIALYNKDIPSAVNHVIQDILNNNKFNHCISATGAHGIIEAHNNPSFKAVLDSFYLNLPDGMPTVWIGKLKGATQMKRCYGPDFFLALMQQSASLPIKHFFCGGIEGVADDLKAECANKCNNKNVVGTYSPPFTVMTDDELMELAKKINQLAIDIIWVGLSTPKQEYFAKRLAKYVHVSFIITVGAAFDFHTGRVRQAPKWVQNAGLEWFFRLLIEPKRLYKRYFTIVPQFIWLNFKEFVEFCAPKKRVL